MGGSEVDVGTVTSGIRYSHRISVLWVSLYLLGYCFWLHAIEIQWFNFNSLFLVVLAKNVFNLHRRLQCLMYKNACEIGWDISFEKSPKPSFTIIGIPPKQGNILLIHRSLYVSFLLCISLSYFSFRLSLLYHLSIFDIHSFLSSPSR